MVKIDLFLPFLGLVFASVHPVFTLVFTPQPIENTTFFKRVNRVNSNLLYKPKNNIGVHQYNIG